MAIKILISALGLIYTYVAIKIIIKIYKDTKRADEIFEQLIMELVWSQHRQENIEALEQQRQEILPKHCIVPSGDYVATAGMPKHGKRVDRASELDAGFRQHELVCPECSAKVTYYVGDNEDLWDAEELNYCPNCRSKMEVKE